MTAYYVLGIAMVVLAIVLSAIGLTRENFPPSTRVGRAIIGGTLLLVLAGMVTLVAVTHVEHPREEAAEAAAKRAEAKGGGEAKAPEKAGGAPRGKTVEAVEKEFSIALQDGKTLQAGGYTFDVANQGKIDHDLAVEGNGLEKKTPLINPGKTTQLAVELKAGKYKLYCTVPGHEQSGMKVDVTVR
jgi:uncharacterized cupredoxin-like copper-binding protein